MRRTGSGAWLSGHSAGTHSIASFQSDRCTARDPGPARAGRTGAGTRSLPRGGERAMSWADMSWPTIGLLTALLVINIAFLVEWLRARRTHPLRDKPTAGD